MLYQQIQYPRLSYLPFLLPRLRDFFAPALVQPECYAHQGWFSFEGLPLKWQYPLGLLYDLFSGAEPTGHTNGLSADNRSNSPWKLILHFSDWPNDDLAPLDADWKANHDAYINSVKEADFLRNGTAKTIMSLSKVDSSRLWTSVQDHDLPNYNIIYQKFMNTKDLPLRNIPIKVYLPGVRNAVGDNRQGTLRVIQGLISPTLSGKDVQTLGTALYSLLPTVFPSRRRYIHAQAALHGAILPLVTPVEQLMRIATYADGFLHIAVVVG